MGNVMDTIYKRDSTGKIRAWRIEVDGAKYRTIAGIKDGNLVESGWTTAKAKNVGKANETTPEQQAQLEANAEYVKKLDRGYFRSVDSIDQKTFTKPMLATDWTKRKKKLDLIGTVVLYFQPKLDGIRCIARPDGLWTRQGKAITSCPHIEEELAPKFAKNPDLVLDGELYNHALRADFNQITSIVRKVKPNAGDIEKSASMIEYHVYDVVCTERDFDERTRWIDQNMRDLNSVVVVETRVSRDIECLDIAYGEWIEAGYEGQMVRLDAPYGVGKRSNDLMKRKEFHTHEFAVIRVEEGNGNWAGCAKRFVVDLINMDYMTAHGLERTSTRECGAGVRGTQVDLKALLDSGKTPDWATVRYFDPTPDGIPRFPVVVDYGFGARGD